MLSKVFILSAPSGTGKTTLANAFCQALAPTDYYRSVSHTTRPARPNEVPGKDYQFVSSAEFHQLCRQGVFLETSKIYEHAYGTLKAPIERALSELKHVVLTLDYQGMQQVKAVYPEAIAIFLLPPNTRSLANRLKQRPGASKKELLTRLRASKLEISRALAYDYCVVNEHFEAALQDLMAIFRAEQLRNLWNRSHLNAATFEALTLDKLVQTFQ